MSHNLTLEQMHKNISRMYELEKQDCFTDKELHETASLFNDYSNLPSIDEFDTPETTETGIDSDGSVWTIGKGSIRNCEKYLVLLTQLQNKLEKINKYEYYRWLTFTDNYKYPESEIEPNEIYKEKISCCICNLTCFKDENEQTRYGGMNATFFRREDVFKIDSCRCEEYKRWWQPTLSYASVVKENHKQNNKVDDKKSSCCFRTCGDAIGSELSSGSRYKYHMIHQCKNCTCFKKQKKGDTRMLSGWYGSRIADDQDYQYIGPDEKYVENGIVCDWCINDMIYNGDLVYLTGS